MLIAITGASGFIGSALTPFLEKDGHKILSVSRSTSGDVLWDPISRQIEAEKLEGVDAVIHLAGENIASKRWTDKQKRKILESRVEGTKLLTKSIVNLSNPPVLTLEQTGFD